MKRVLVLLLGVISGLLVGCTSITPVMANGDFPAEGDYAILGRVMVVSETSKSGYSQLLEEAKELYPDCDDVLNIILDTKQTSFLFFRSKPKYIMSGIAVDYLDM